MTTVASGDLCHVTVEGPDRRADLAVPATTPVAALLPVLLLHTADQASTDLVRPEESWVLQRLGGAPFDPTGTPESLDWLEGERLYLRPVENQLPVLHFDDVSEGIAETVNKRRDRWQPEYRRHLFIGVSAVVAVVLATVLFTRAPVPMRIGVGSGFALLMVVAAAQFARHLNDAGFSLLFGLGACSYAALTVMDTVDGSPAHLAFTLTGLGVGFAVAAGVALVLVVLQRLWAEAIPYPVFLTVMGLAATLNCVQWLRNTFGMDGPGAAGLTAAILFGTVLFAPNLVLRAGRLRGPQLPKTGSELQYDIEPHPADELDKRTNEADNYLSVLVICVSVALPLLFPVIMTETGWAGWTLVAVISGAVLLRARVLLSVWQRVAFTVCGSAGVIMLILRFSRGISTGWLIVLLIGLTVLLTVTVLAALRPWPRRLLPIWEFIATVLDVVAALALLPIVLQLVHAYAWARGLAG